VTETFEPPVLPDTGYEVSVEPRLRSARFGDGYGQDVPDGLNAQPRRVQLTWSDVEAEDAEAILRFLETRGGHEAFWYELPDRPRNLLVRSDGFDQASWTPVRVVAALATGAAPPAGRATLLTTAATDGEIAISQAVANVPPGVLTLTAWWAQGTCPLRPQLVLNATNPVYVLAEFDPINRTMTPALAGGVWSVRSAAAAQLRDGWWRLSLCVVGPGGLIGAGIRSGVAPAATGLNWLLSAMQLQVGDPSPAYRATGTAPTPKAAWAATRWSIAPGSGSHRTVVASLEERFLP
jgi:phage-related protein